MVRTEKTAVRPEKTEAVTAIAGRFTESEAAILTEYRGLRVSEIAEVRGALRDAGADYKVLKNTLARIAVREIGLDELVEQLEGPTAVVFIHGDLVEAAKVLDDAAKKYPVLLVKGGTLKGKLLTAEDAKALARLESREILLSKVAMLANSPLQRTVNVFAAMLRDLGSMLAQVLGQKESEQPAAAAEAEPEVAPAEAEAEPEVAPAETEAEPEVEGPIEETAEVQSEGGPVVEGEPPEVKAEGDPGSKS